MKFFTPFSLLLLASHSYAATSIECGIPATDLADGPVYELKKTLYQFSSENDHFSGLVGDEWQMAIGQKWLEGGSGAKAKTKNDGSGQVLYISSPTREGVGRVATRYEVKYLFTDNPILTIKRSIGGSDARIKTQKMICVGMYD